MSAKKNGFAIIELLIVIIISAVLFPVFSKAQEKSRQISCLSNMKQIGSAVLAYTADYDKVYPPGRLDNWPGTGYGMWGMANLLHPYTKNYSMWTCPSQPTSGTGIASVPGVPGLLLAPPTYGRYNWHYSISTYVCPALAWHGGTISYAAPIDFAPPLPKVTRSVTDLGFPSETILLAEIAVNSNCNSDACNYSVSITSLKTHNGGSNFTFADGHVKWFEYAYLQTTIPGTHYPMRHHMFYPDHF